MEIEFTTFKLPINEGIVMLYIAIIGISYYFIFRKHHKDNLLKFADIYPLFINYSVLCIISTFVLIFGVDVLLTGYMFQEQRSEVVLDLIAGLSIISIVILNFIYYIKKNKAPVNIEMQEEKNKMDAKISEWIELIIFIAMFVYSIFNIIKYSNFVDELEKQRQVLLYSISAIISIFLLLHFKPLNIKEKFKIYKKKWN